MQKYSRESDENEKEVEKKRQKRKMEMAMVHWQNTYIRHKKNNMCYIVQRVHTHTHTQWRTYITRIGENVAGVGFGFSEMIRNLCYTLRQIEMMRNLHFDKSEKDAIEATTKTTTKNDTRRQCVFIHLDSVILLLLPLMLQ